MRWIICVVSIALLIGMIGCDRRDFNTKLLESNHDLTQDRYHQRQATTGEWNLWFHMDAPAYGAGQAPVMIYDLTSTSVRSDVKPYAVIDIEVVQAVSDDPFAEKPEKLERYQFRGEVELVSVNAGHWQVMVDNAFRIGQPTAAVSTEVPQNWLPLKGNYWMHLKIRPFGMQAIELEQIPFDVKDGSGAGPDFYTNESR